MFKKQNQQATKSKRKPVPISVEDFGQAATEFYYVDKTLLIKNIIDNKTPVTLFTRPRRFGKSLNLSMLRTFFEKSKKNTSIYFRDKNIWKCGREYRKEQGKYPVIYLDFKDIDVQSWEDASGKIISRIIDVYASFPELLKSKRVNHINDLPYYKDVVSKSLGISEYQDALQKLSRMLTSHYGVAPVIIIDEYDKPIQSGYDHGYYDDALSFMKNFLSAGLKGNNANIHYAFISGVLQVGQVSAYSGLNNIYASTVLDCDDYSEFFGFTAEETKSMLEYYGLADRYPEVCEWYDGYLFGKTEIFNPWSVLKYIKANAKAGTYWVDTGENDIIYNVMSNISSDTAGILSSLLKEESITVHVDKNVTFNKLKENSSYVYTILVHSGYLKVVDAKNDANTWTLTMPNREIYEVYSSEIISAIAGNDNTANTIRDALLNGDVDAFKNELASFLASAISVRTLHKEYFYQVLMIGILAIMNGRYILKEEFESGSGYPDIILIPRNPSAYPGIIIEIKTCSSAQGLVPKAKEAVAQIDRMKYDAALKTAGCSRIYKIGAAFCTKDVEVILEQS
ncbi:MAG: ATP-binding protein [Clostridia bacterium]|nr:ATP-binding protein [Clostridia bacterium]